MTRLTFYGYSVMVSNFMFSMGPPIGSPRSASGRIARAMMHPVRRQWITVKPLGGKRYDIGMIMVIFQCQHGELSN